MNFPLQNGQPQFNNRFLPPPNQSQMPAGANNLPQSTINALHRRVRGLIQSGQ
jgi:hypothetical protein